MNAKIRQALRERIAGYFNHGLSNQEIFSEYLAGVKSADLIGVIRDLIQEQKETDSTMNANSLCKFEGNIIQMTIPPDQLDNNNGGRGLEIRVPGYKKNPEDQQGAQIFIEIYQGKLRVHVWNGTPDPTTTEIDPQ